MQQDSTAAAGWYPDGVGAVRWWDGERWTGDRKSASDRSPARSVDGVAPHYRLPNADGTPTVDVVGESDRLEEIAAVLGRALKKDERHEQRIDVQLVPEPDRPGDPTAVSVRAQGRVIGYLPDSAAYQPALARITASGVVPTTGAHLRATRTTRGLRASVRLTLVDPELLTPVNALPTGPYSLIPWGRGLQVLREDEHFARLVDVLPGGGRGLVVVTLHPLDDRIELRLDGARVGELSPAVSQHFAPTVRHLTSLGLTTAAYAALRSSPLQAELTLQAARASELPERWVDGPPVTLPPLLPRTSAYDLPAAYVKPLRPTALTSEEAARGTRRLVAWIVVGTSLLVGFSSWILGDVLN
ncbi:DUF2510 domain-containing protein [Rathayibacter sp. SD072]|uniref:DUF2510 domain-containing protein n=1 Tax=Rathayibacter sp. SD072 TaxID=2781731 RepID=UPI001A97B61A|nr:DUF2510 domain-containing protein [Rathayibacter sp. SD072]MBO0983921.1 DUF2510 domain-containing protein [Rathayibacter sp. SD072]